MQAQQCLVDVKALQSDTAAMARHFEAKVNNSWAKAQCRDTGVRMITVEALYA